MGGGGGEGGGFNSSCEAQKYKGGGLVHAVSHRMLAILSQCALAYIQ